MDYDINPGDRVWHAATPDTEGTVRSVGPGGKAIVEWDDEPHLPEFDTHPLETLTKVV